MTDTKYHCGFYFFTGLCCVLVFFSSSLFVMFSCFLVNDISSLSLDVERYSLHQYSLRTNNWHISTEYSVIWRGDRCDGVTCDLKVLHPSIPDRRNERIHTIHSFNHFIYVYLFSSSAHTLHSFGCFDFCMCMPVPSVFCRSRHTLYICNECETKMN